MINPFVKRGIFVSGGKAVEEMILKHFGRPYDIKRELDYGSWGPLVEDVIPYVSPDIQGFLEGDTGAVCLAQLLNALCYQGVLKQGEYLVYV